MKNVLSAILIDVGHANLAIRVKIVKLYVLISVSVDVLHQEHALNANQVTQEKTVKLSNAYQIVKNAQGHSHVINVIKDISYQIVNLQDNNNQINPV